MGSTTSNLPSIKVGFAKRQTAESHHGHYAGSEESLVALIAPSMDKAIPVNEAKTILRVPVPAEGFMSSIRPLAIEDVFTTAFQPRADGEEPVLRTVIGSTSAGSQKVPARSVEIILYHKDVLGKDATTGADWEVVSINPSPFDGPVPLDPVTMARNQLQRIGGTFQKEYSPKEWAESVWFWARHAPVCR